jgi:hypothetical protein
VVAVDLGLQGVEAVDPELAVAVQPAVDLTQRSGGGGCTLMPNSSPITVAILPAGNSPSASNSRIRRRTGSPRMSNACTDGSISVMTYMNKGWW